MRGFIAKVNHRKALLNHLKDENYNLYLETIKALNIENKANKSTTNVLLF